MGDFPPLHPFPSHTAHVAGAFGYGLRTVDLVPAVLVGIVLLVCDHLIGVSAYVSACGMPLPEGAVVVVDNILPGYFARLDLEKVGAIVSEHGGPTSHGAIFARTLEIPAVTGVAGVLDACRPGEQAIVDGRAEDIVYTNLFTGVHGNYLRKSIEEAGLDPDNLPESDPSAMNFGSGGGSDAKAWKDIWGSGQGIGSVKAIQSAGEYIDQLAAEYEETKARLCG